MNIENPTQFTLRKIHQFDLLNPDKNQRVLIDVLEPMGAAAGRIKIVAVPNLVGFKEGATHLCGEGESIEAAINDCLAKISAISWEELNTAVTTD
jgi:hypothetical protein